MMMHLMTYALLAISAVMALMVMHHADGEAWFASAGVLLVDASIIGFVIATDIIGVL